MLKMVDHNCKSASAGEAVPVQRLSLSTFEARQELRNRIKSWHSSIANVFYISILGFEWLVIIRKNPDFWHNGKFKKWIPHQGGGSGYWS